MELHPQVSKHMVELGIWSHGGFFDKNGGWFFFLNQLFWGERFVFQMMDMYWWCFASVMGCFCSFFSSCWGHLETSGPSFFLQQQKHPRCRHVNLYIYIYYIYIWVFPRIVVPQNGWFTMENRIKMDDLRATPYFRKQSYIYHPKSLPLKKKNTIFLRRKPAGLTPNGLVQRPPSTGCYGFTFHQTSLCCNFSSQLGSSQSRGACGGWFVEGCQTTVGKKSALY